MAPQPTLRQNHNASSATLIFTTFPRYKGLTVYFFRKSGQTGKVAPLGTGVIGDGGTAFRTMNDLKPGQIIRAYGKMTGSDGNIATPYSNDVSWKTGS